jgi:hypothetical protein
LFCCAPDQPIHAELQRDCRSSVNETNLCEGTYSKPPLDIKLTAKKLNILYLRHRPYKKRARRTRAQDQINLGGNRREGRIKVKSIKMLGLTALAALMAMAFVGASSAMAGNTQLCKTDPAGGACSAGNNVTHVHEATLAGVQAVLKTSILTLKCDVLFLSTSVGALAAPQKVFGNFTYTNCNNNCVVTEENGPAEILVLRTAAETSTVTGEGLVHVECGSFIDCLYNHTNLLGAGKGALTSAETNGEVKIVEQSLSEEGGSFFCPDTTKLTITTIPLSATYIGS